MSSCTCHSDTAVADGNEYGCCPLQFGLLRNTPHWGKIVVTRPSALCLLSSWSQNPMDARFFQSLLTFSPVSGVVPNTSERQLTRRIVSRMRYHSHQSTVSSRTRSSLRHFLFRPLPTYTAIMPSRNSALLFNPGCKLFWKNCPPSTLIEKTCTPG